MPEKQAIAPPPANAQTTSRVLLVKPFAFYANEETAKTNAFQTLSSASPAELTAQMETEFSRMAALLEQNGVQVMRMDGPAGSPDAIFPNNVFSTHAQGRAVLYPLLAENRFRELTPQLEKFLRENYEEVVSYRGLKEKGLHLEGTGSLVLDRVNKIAYAALSPRTSLEAATIWAQDMGYALVPFAARDKGLEIYHTNVMMFLGTSAAAVCLECVEEGKEDLAASLEKTGHEIIPLSVLQMREMCGNAIELRDEKGRPLLVMSARAYNAYAPEQRETLARHCGRIVHADISTIETCGGGSARCMIAEIF